MERARSSLTNRSFVARRDVGVNALGVRAVAERTQYGVGLPGGHAFDVQKDGAVARGGDEQLSIVRQCEAGGRRFERDDAEELHASLGAFEDRDAWVLSRVVAHEGDEDLAAVGRGPHREGPRG